MEKTGRGVLAGLIIIALTAPLCHANSLEILLHCVNNNTSQTAQPSNDASPENQINDAVVDVVVTEMSLLRSFFLMFSPESKGAEKEVPAPATSLP